MVNKGMSNKTIIIRRPVQQLIPLEVSRDPAEELNHCKDTDRDFENEDLAEQRQIMQTL